MHIPLLTITKSTSFNIIQSLGPTPKLYNCRGSWGDLSILSFTQSSSNTIMFRLMSQGDLSHGYNNPHVFSSIHGLFSGNVEYHHLFPFYNPQIPISNLGLWILPLSTLTLNYAINIYFSRYAKALMKVMNTLNSSDSIALNYTPNVFDVIDIVNCVYLVIASAYKSDMSNDWTNYGSGTSNHYRLVPPTSPSPLYNPFVAQFSNYGEYPFGIEYSNLYYSSTSLNVTYTLGGFPSPPPQNTTRVVLMAYPLFPYTNSYPNTIRVKNLPLTLKFTILEPCEIKVNDAIIKTNTNNNIYETYALEVEPKDQVSWYSTNTSRPFSCFLSAISVRG